MHRHSNESGIGKIAVFFILVLLGLVIHVGMKLVPMYMDYERMKDTMAIKAGVAQVLKDEEILRDLVAKARELDLPLGPENFQMSRDEERRRMKISTSWEVEIRFAGGLYIRTFHFAPVVEEGFMSFAR